MVQNLKKIFNWERIFGSLVYVWATGFRWFFFSCLVFLLSSPFFLSFLFFSFLPYISGALNNRQAGMGYPALSHISLFGLLSSLCNKPGENFSHGSTGFCAHWCRLSLHPAHPKPLDGHRLYPLSCLFSYVLTHTPSCTLYISPCVSSHQLPFSPICFGYTRPV